MVLGREAGNHAQQSETDLGGYRCQVTYVEDDDVGRDSPHLLAVRVAVTVVASAVVAAFAVVSIVENARSRSGTERRTRHGGYCSHRGSPVRLRISIWCS